MSISLFNLYDYLFIAFMLFFACVGLVRGFWIQFFSIIVWLLGGILYYCGPQVEQVYLSKYLSVPVAHWFLLAVVLVGCFFINFLVRFLLGSLFKLNAFTFFNKMGGLVLGIIGGGLIITLLIYAVNSSDMKNEAADWKKSYVVSLVTPLLDTLNEYSNQKLSLATVTTKSGDTLSATDDIMEAP